MAKPFSIQSPEEIAKEYGGNKQKIAQAMQMGIVDATAGVLAGMFIDRMRSAQMQEGAPQATVAQQVMGGAPSAPPALPAPPAGAAPQAMPPMAPPMAGPQTPPVGMAEGGIAGLDIPDTMYDEPSNGGFNDGYAGGGLVAFGDGGPVGPWLEEQALEAIPGVRVTSRQRSAAKNAQVGGNPKSYHLTNNARDFVPPKGGSMGSLHKQLASLYGPGYDVINEGDHIHVEPGPRREKRTPARAAAPVKAPAATPVAQAPALAEADMDAGGTPGVMAQIEALQKMRAEDMAAAKKERRQAAAMALAQRGLAMMMPNSAAGGMFAEGGAVRGYAAAGAVVGGAPVTPGMALAQRYGLDPASLAATQQGLAALMPQQNKYSDLLMQDVDRRMSEDYAKTERKQVLNNALMNFGLALMATKNPSFLGAVGESGAPVASAMQADLKDLKKEARAALIEGAQMEGMKNEAARELAKLTLDRANVMAELQKSDLDRASREKLEEKKMNLDWAITKYTQGQETARLNTRIAAERELAGAGPKEPYDIGSRKIVIGNDKRGKPIEREISTRTNKRTGDVEYYSNEAGTYLTPEYASVLATRPNAITGLQNWAKQHKARIDVVDGRLIASDASGNRQLVDTNFLKQL